MSVCDHWARRGRKSVVVIKWNCPRYAPMETGCLEYGKEVCVTNTVGGKMLGSAKNDDRSGQKLPSWGGRDSKGHGGE